MRSLLIVCLALACALAAEARPKRSVYLAAAPAVVASVPVVRSAAVVHSVPHTSSVTKTEQVQDGAHSSYSYSTEVKSAPVVHTHAAVAAAPAVAPAVAAVSTVHHAVPAYTYGYYPAAHYAYYSPYHYVVGK